MRNPKIPRWLQPCIAVLICLFSAWGLGQTAPPLSLEQNGWTIVCSPDSTSLTISATNLGTVARDLRLNRQTPSGLQRLTRFSARINADRQLILETTAPHTTWVIDALPGKLTISTTSFRGVLTGSAVSSSNRTIAILLDPQGQPVKWEGTYEDATNYGGSLTSNQSYLPRRNPEVMHLGLGHVSGAGMHSLFDRITDIAIDFGENADLQAAAGASDAYALTVPVPGYAAIQLTPDYFTNLLHVPFYVRYDDTYSPTAPAVWSSWPNYYESVTEKDIVRNTDWLAANLKPYGLEYVVLDDGYDRTADFSHPQVSAGAPAPQTYGHSWIQNWSPERFPHGPAWLTSYIHSKGLKAGVWLVPNTYGPALNEHPDWYLYDKQGKVMLDYDTPALDSTNPQVLGFLQHLFKTLDDFGFDYYKFDGEEALPAYAPPVDRSRLYSPSADPVQAFRNRFAVIRKAVGPERFIEECPAGTPLNALGFVNSYFNGQDVYANWNGMYPLFSSISGNLFLNHMVTYVMPGEGLELNQRMTMAEAATKLNPTTIDAVRSRENVPTGFGTTLQEARTQVSYIALTGVVYSLAGVMPDLPPDRVNLLKATMPTLPILPIDLFSRGTEKNMFTPLPLGAVRLPHFPEVLDLKVDAAAGVYDVAALTNWQAEAAARSLFFSQLGLPTDLRYVVFDFWKQQPLGVFSNRLDLSIEPHDTRVLFVHPLTGSPQLIGNSRHISGTYSIVSQGWNQQAKELVGESAAISGQPYTLWFYLPNGYRKASLQVTLSKTGKAVSARWQQQAEFAGLTFTGADEPVMWRIRF